MLHHQLLKKLKMTAKGKITKTLTRSVKRKLPLLELAAEPQSVSRACQVMG